VRIRLAALILLAGLAVAAAAFLGRGDAASAVQRCSGAFPPKRPDLANFRVTGMTCWAAKLLIDEAMEQHLATKKKIVLLGFTCRYKPTSEASGVVICSGRGASARADSAVF
jgi:hypothetical protein